MSTGGGITHNGSAIPRGIQEIREVDGLSELQRLFGEATIDDAYLAAKRRWYTEMAQMEEQYSPQEESLFGPVVVDDVTFSVHGVTHYGTREEREYVVERVEEWIERDEQVFIEQGIDRYIESDIRPELWSGSGETGERADIVEEMDDFSWVRATAPEPWDKETDYDTVFEDVFDEYDEVLSGQAATDTEQLPALQAYCEKTKLPVHLERSWLQRHAPGLAYRRHGRSERMADYAVHTAVPDQNVDRVHIVTGAQHRTGVLDYLRAYRDGDKELQEDFTYYPQPDAAAD